jgi:hypothetical protein
MHEGPQPQFFLNVPVGIIRERAEHYASFTRFLLSDRCYLLASYFLLFTDY